MDNPCDLLVLDLGLPAVVALVIARRLLEQQPGLGIVMLTARGSLNDRLSGLEEGADACVWSSRSIAPSPASVLILH